MRFLVFVLTAIAHTAAWAHHTPLHVDVICTEGDSSPVLALLPFVVLAAIGIVRAVARHRKDR